MNSSSRYLFLILIAVCGAPMANASDAAWLKAKQVDGIVGCDVGRGVRVGMADLRYDGTAFGADAVGSPCAGALASLMRRSDVSVRFVGASAPDEESLVFDLTSLGSPVPVSLGCVDRAGQLVVSWVDPARLRTPRPGESCVDNLIRARANGYTVRGSAAALAKGSERDHVVYTYQSAFGTPNRGFGILDCRLSDSGEFLVSFADASVGQVANRIRRSVSCAVGRRVMMARGGLLESQAPLPAERVALHPRLYFEVSTRVPGYSQARVHSCDFVPDHAPAGDMLLVSDSNGRVVRREPLRQRQACSLLGADATAGEDGLTYEVAMSPELVRLAGGVDRIAQSRTVPMSCRQCRESKGIEPPGEDTVPYGAPYGALIVYPGEITTIGYNGSFPWNYHFDDVPPVYNSPEFTSYCANADSVGTVHYGPLTNAKGWEVVLQGSDVVYGDEAYVMLDTTSQGTFVRAANVSPQNAVLRPTGWIDECGQGLLPILLQN